MVLWFESVIIESGWMMCDFRSTWHLSGTVIIEEERTVLEGKEEGHLIVVENPDGKEKINSLLAIWKNVKRSNLRLDWLDSMFSK
jgi:hypothetical protein